MNCVSCDICVYHLGLFVFFPGVFPNSRVTRACPVTTDLIMRVNVRTTTTTPVARFYSSKIYESLGCWILSSAIPGVIPGKYQVSYQYMCTTIAEQLLLLWGDDDGIGTTTFVCNGGVCCSHRCFHPSTSSTISVRADASHFSFLLFPLLAFLLFSLFFPIDLRLRCVCVVICTIYV